MDHRQLLKKYITYVGDEEGTTFLGVRGGMLSEVEFTEEEWQELKKLEDEPLTISKETHSCSCHAQEAGPCGVCKELGCKVWDFNKIAELEPNAFIKQARLIGLSLDDKPNAFGGTIELGDPHRYEEE